jgi:tetratricopeptide (TPR) repeat protein
LTDYYRKNNEYRKNFKYLIQSFKSRMIELDRKLAIMSYYLSEEKYIKQYPGELEKMLKVLKEVHPEETDVKLMAADFYMETRDYQEAYYQLKEYLEIRDGNYPIYMQTIMFANAASMNEELIRITELALEVYPDSADLRFFRGIGLYEEGRYEELVENFEKVCFEAYSSGEYAMQSNMLYAEALYRLKKYHRSDSVFEHLIREDPGNFMVMNNYSYYLAERGEKHEKARKWSRLVVTNHPDNFTYLDTYAWVLYKLRQYEDAEKYILKALWVGPKLLFLWQFWETLVRRILFLKGR